MFDAADQPAEATKPEAPEPVTRADSDHQVNRILLWLLLYAAATAVADYFKMSQLSTMLGQIAQSLLTAAFVLLRVKN
jgi:hypothetical protein